MTSDQYTDTPEAAPEDRRRPWKTWTARAVTAALIVGTFAEHGVTCEACHGSGAAHARTRSKNDIVLIAPGRATFELQQPMAGYGMAVSCKECHTRDGLKVYRADGDPDIPGHAQRIFLAAVVARDHARRAVAEPLVELPRAQIALQGIDEDRPASGIGEAAIHGGPHHRRVRRLRAAPAEGD